VAKDRGDASQLGAHVRGHWGIENKVHYVRDWTFDEDRHQMRAPGSRPRALATLRNLAISLMRRMSHFVWNLGDGPRQLSYAATSFFAL
jgi:predicted transposase YbfD/YdcC